MEKLIKVALLVGVFYLGARFLGFGGATGAEMEGLRAMAKVQGKDRIVVLLTGTSWCRACQMLDENVIQKRDWESFISSEAVFAKYDYGASERPTTGAKGEMLKKFDIEGFPTMIIMDEDGEVIEEIPGYNRGGLAYYKARISR